MGRYEFDFTKSLEIEKKMAQIPDKSEELVNKVLKTKGTKIMIDHIVEEMPRSNKKKIHAKDSNSLKFRMKNLGFEIVAKGGASINKGSFGYLAFPNDGQGPHNPIAQRFFEKGGDKSNEAIQDKVIEALEQAHDILIEK